MKHTLKLTTGAVGLGLIVSFGVATVAQAGGPVGGCPEGKGSLWQVSSVNVVRPSDVGNKHDQNDDGWICFRVNKGLSKKLDNNSVWVVKDNTNRLPSAPPPTP